jgi:hypothetical protein
MTTRSNVSRRQRIQSAIWLVVMLLVSGVVSGKSIQASRCPQQQKTGVAVTTLLAAQTTAAERAADRSETPFLSSSTGVDLEVRIWNVRIGFPWLKSLPVTPGRRIVVSLWEPDADR